MRIEELIVIQVTELENKLISNNKELHAAQDLNQALQHEYKETMAQKEDQVRFNIGHLAIKLRIYCSIR